MSSVEEYDDLFLENLTYAGQESHEPNHVGTVRSGCSLLLSIYIGLKLEDLQQVLGNH